MWEPQSQYNTRNTGQKYIYRVHKPTGWHKSCQNCEEMEDVLAVYSMNYATPETVRDQYCTTQKESWNFFNSHNNIW